MIISAWIGKYAHQIKLKSQWLLITKTEEKISEQTLDIKYIDFPETLEKLLVITCIVSGLPAPKITWSHTLDPQYKTGTFSKVNPDGTVTVVSNLTHPVLKTIEWTEVTCVVHHPALGAEKRLSKRIHYPVEPYSNEEKTSTEGHRIRFLVIIYLAVPACFLLLILMCTTKSKCRL